jgi:hypothetical protein
MRTDGREREREEIRQQRVARNNLSAEWDRAWRLRMRALNVLMRARELAAEPFERLRSS